MAGNIIPAIATTNAMTAGLCVLQAFKVLRKDLPKAKMVFLARSTERCLNSEPLRPPNPDCAVCSVAQSRILVDPARATLGGLIEKVLRPQLGYGEELSVRTDESLLYDPDIDENLTKSFAELNVKGDTFITVTDEEDENPRVDLVLSVVEEDLAAESEPIVLPDKVEIARKSVKAPVTNGEASSNGTSAKRKREGEDLINDDEHLRKRGKVAEPPHKVQNGDDDVVVLDDSTGGAIVIDD